MKIRPFFLILLLVGSGSAFSLVTLPAAPKAHATGIVPVQSVFDQAYGTAIFTVFGSEVTAGDAIVVVLQWVTIGSSCGTAAITDNLGTVPFVNAVNQSEVYSGNDYCVYIGAALLTSSGPDWVQAIIPLSISVYTEMWEVSGISPTALGARTGTASSGATMGTSADFPTLGIYSGTYFAVAALTTDSGDVAAGSCFTLLGPSGPVPDGPMAAQFTTSTGTDCLDSTHLSTSFVAYNGNSGSWWIDTGAVYGPLTPASSGCYRYSLIGGGSFNGPVMDSVDIYGAHHLTPLTIRYQCLTGSSYVMPLDLTGASVGLEERAQTQNSTSSLITSGNYTFVYWHQFEYPFSWSLYGSGTPTTNPTLSGVTFGVPFTITLTHAIQWVWLDAMTIWTAENPFISDLQMFYPSPGSGYANNGLSMVVNVVYSKQGNCSATTQPFQLEQKGCIAPAIYFQWFNIMGPFFIGFLDCLAALAVYLRTESPGLAMMTYMVVGGVAGGLTFSLLPSPLVGVGVLIVGGVIAGGVFQVLRTGKAG